MSLQSMQTSARRTVDDALTAIAVRAVGFLILALLVGAVEVAAANHFDPQRLVDATLSILAR